MSGQLAKPHPSYEDSTIRWIGAHPSSWNLTRVKFESYVKARVGWHGLKSDDFTAKGPYLVTGTDFSGSRINWQDCHHCDEWRYDQDPYIQLREGDLLVTKDGTIGKLALVEGLDGKATLNSGVFVVRPLTPRYISRFYFWLLQSSVFHGFVEYRKTGSTIVHLYQETFENFSFAMPPVAEQTQIARFLDYETAKIDALIEKQQQLIALLKEKRQAVISHAVTKGLNPDAPLRDSGVEWLGEVPAHWTVPRIRYVARVFNGSTPSRDVPQYWVEEGIPWISSGKVNEDIIQEPTSWISKRALAECSLELAPKGSVVVGMIGQGKTRATCAMLGIESTINQNMAALVVGRSLNSRYLYRVMTAAYYDLRLLGRGANQPALNCDILRAYRIPLPPLEEQRAIAEYTREMLQRTGRTMELAAQQRELLQERRTALISAAVTGKIDVRE